MSTSKPPPGPVVSTDQEVLALLTRYQSPTPFHVVRTLFMGGVASPRLGVSPLATLTQIWGAEMPEFTSRENVEEVARVLVHGLWNRLAENQSARNPFRLTRFEVTPTRQALHDLALRRVQELQGFVDGLFGPEEEMLLPQKAHDAVQALVELHSMFGSVATLLADEEKPASTHELKVLLRNLQQLTIAADECINKAVQSCKRSRGQHLEAMATMPSRRSMTSGFENSVTPDMPELDDSQEPEFIESPLSQSITRNGISVQVEIYGDSQGQWILEIVDAENASHVWDEPFETDQQALAEALRALDEETLEFFGGATARH